MMGVLFGLIVLLALTWQRVPPREGGNVACGKVAIDSGQSETDTPHDVQDPPTEDPLTSAVAVRKTQSSALAALQTTHAIEADLAAAFADLALPVNADVSPSSSSEPFPDSIPRAQLRAIEGDVVAPSLPAASTFPEPWIIRAQLADLRSDVHVVAWAEHIDGMIDRLVGTNSLVDDQLIHMIDEIEAAVDELASIEAGVASEDTARDLRLISYDLRRRIIVWRAAHRLSQSRRREPVQISAAQAGTSALHVMSASARSEVELPQLLEAIERFEYTRLTSHGRQLSDAIDQLRSSSRAEDVALAEQLERHYRNANVRVAVTDILLNRMLPQQGPLESDVNDYILGIPVWGRSKTFTELKVRLVPDEHRLRVGLEAWGKVQSNTTASSGPVKLRNRGKSAFIVRKLIVVDQDGLRTKQSHAEAESATNLVGIESNYDDVPLIGNFVRRLAERRHTDQRGMALRETERKIVRESRLRFDREIEPRIAHAVKSFENEIWNSLIKLRLDPEPISLATTDRRAVARVRLADADQLSAYTARPRALGNSLLSMQVHESVLNNVLDKLDLAGKTMTLLEVYDLICEQFDTGIDKPNEEMPKNVRVTFADYNPIRVRFQDGVLKLTLSLSKLEKGKKTSWNNLVVHADYEPVRDGLNISLTRSEAIRLDGDRLRFGDQIAMRGVFSKVLSQNNRMNLVPSDFSEDKRLADLVVTQSVIQDGWIGISIGPNRDHTARATARSSVR